MKKILLLIALTFHYAFSYGQNIINNKLTNNHKNVEGSKISLIPPKGFIKATNFQGFLNEDIGSTIMVLEAPVSFSESAKELNKENFVAQGVAVNKIENFKINGLPAIFMTVEQISEGVIYSKFVFAFGTETETILINSIFPKKGKNISKELKNSILSTYYDPAKIINHLENVDFIINTTGTKFKLSNSVANSLIYTTDGNVPTKSEDKASLIVGKSFTEKVIDQKEVFAINRFLQLPITIPNPEELPKATKKIEIGGLSGFEVIGKGKDKSNGNDKLAYQVILFDENLYYIILGLCEADFEKNLGLYKDIAKTFKKK